MSNLFDKLELKFKNIETRIENKKKFVINLCNGQEKLLNERFNSENSNSKYAEGLNDQRQRLLDQIKVIIRLEMDKMTEAKSLCINHENVQGFSKKFTKSLIFKRSQFNSTVQVCIRKLINNDIKFTRQFSARKLIKFKDLLSISDFLKQKDNSIEFTYDLNATLEVECDSLRPNLDLIRLLIDGGANINPKDRFCTALINASHRGHQEVVRLLLDEGAAINPKKYNGLTALIVATRNNHLEVVKLLLDYGADLNNKPINNETPLMTAFLSGNLKMVELLLEKRVIENKYLDVDLALDQASRHGKLEIVKQILVRVDDCAKYVYRALVGNRNLEAVRLLLDHGANGKCVDEALVYASSAGDLEIVKLLIEKRADLNAKDRYGNTALIRASSNRHFEVVKLLLNNGADVNVQDNDGLTALLRTLSTEMRNLLLENGADINANNRDKAIICATSRGDLDLLKTFLNKGGIVDAEALFIATSNRHLEVIKLLLDYGVEVNAKNSDGETALIKALSKGHLEIVKLLLNNGAKYSFTALKMASVNGHLEIEKMLLEKRVGSIYKNESLGEKLIHAAYFGNLDDLKAILKKGADANAKNKEGQTTLIVASLNGHLEMVKFLLNTFVDLNAKDNNGRTALMEATIKGHLNIVELLLKYDADINASDNNRSTALIEASSNGHLEIVKLLSDKGANLNAINLF